MLKRPVYLTIVALSAVLLSHDAIAQLTLSPSSLQLATTQHQNISRTIQISADTALQSLQLSVSDLEKVDNADRLLASKIMLTPISSSLQSGDTATVVLSVAAAALPSSGKYSGELIVSHDLIRQTVPLTIQIKDSVYIPSLIMLGGVFLGSILSNYRVNGRPHDEVIIGVGRLRTQLRSDTEFAGLAGRFCYQVEANLVDVETALNQRDWDAAERALSTAQESWDRWRRGRENWIELLKYKRSLLKKVADTSMASFPYGEYIRAQLAQFDRYLPAEDNSPENAREQLSEIKQQVSWYLEGEALVERLYNRIKSFSAPEKEQWQAKAIEKEEALHSFTPSGNETFRNTFVQWRQSVQADLDTVAQLSTTGGSRTAGLLVRSHVETLPALPFQSTPTISRQTVRRANRRLRILTWVARVIAIGLLAWAGMVELYENNPTFGAAPMGDYFMLVAWGFGAEVTRESVVKAIQDLSVPIQKNKKN